MCHTWLMKNLPDDPEELKELYRSLESTVNAWWDIRSQNESQVQTLVMDAFAGYLRTSRNGGMPVEDSDMVLAVVEEASRNILEAVWPVILRIADKHRNDLLIPMDVPEAPDLEDVITRLGRISEGLTGGNKIGLLLAINELEEYSKHGI